MARLILVVENDPPLLQALADTVSQLGYDATLATTVADGVTLAELASRACIPTCRSSRSPPPAPSSSPARR
jgi:DNA-binding response OmpR family regulator